MRTPASIAGHPIHPMLVPIPIGLWLFSFVCDFVYLWGGGGPNWATVAYYTAAGGVVGALLAAVPGFIDMLSLPAGPKRTALAHMSLNLTIVALYAVNVWLRTTGAESSRAAFLLSLTSVALLVVSGWLGGKMVYEHGVAVDTAAVSGRGVGGPRDTPARHVRL
jgi:uncharacterized membrane protein